MRTKLSQRLGLSPIPQQMKPHELSDEIRNKIWSILYARLDEGSTRNVRGIGYLTGSTWTGICRKVWVDYFHRPLHLFPYQTQALIDLFLPFIMRQDCVKVLELLEEIINMDNRDARFLNDLRNCLRDFPIAYKLIEEGAECLFIPISTESEGQAVAAAFETISKYEYNGAQSHLEASAKFLKNREWDHSVRESIHAVESVAKTITEEATLSKALSKLEKSGVHINAQFKAGLEKIYAYTNSEHGIRHASLGVESKVDEADALFMFGACASFCSYLANKTETSKT